jgi:hypothetical protein
MRTLGTCVAKKPCMKPASLAVALTALVSALIGCGSTPLRVASGTVAANGNDFGSWHSTEGRCDRGNNGDRATTQPRESKVPVRLTFRSDTARRDTVIEIPYEPNPTYVNVLFPPSYVTLTRRQCKEFDARVDAQSIDGVDGTFASGKLHLSCSLPQHDETLDVTVDFEQC